MSCTLAIEVEKMHRRERQFMPAEVII